MIRRLLPAALLAVCIARLWLMPLGSSFWVDEAETAFVVHFGYHHPSLAIVPQITASLYYWLPFAAEKIFGFSEAVLRIPSLLAMGIALFFIFRLATRLIHPEAGWFAVFACLAIRGIDYEAGNARPYALGICVASAALWALVRWMDSQRWLDGLLFVVLAGLLCWVQLIYWPFYVIPVLYVVLKQRVAWPQVGAIFALLAAAMIPVLTTALYVARNGGETHAFAPVPTLRDLFGSFKFLLPAVCFAGAWLLSRMKNGATSNDQPPRSAVALIVGWWAAQPLCIYAFSLITGNSVFSPRYLSLGWPGTALASTLAALFFMPPKCWRPAAIALGVAALVLFGQWNALWPPHHNSDWRAASRAVNALDWGAATPVIFPSPFVEGKPPIWRPDYPLPGFLYCYLTVYPVTGEPYLLPYEDSPEARRYAETLPHDRRFVIYGDNRNVHLWQGWFAARPELQGWRNRLLGPFGDVDVALFEAP